MLGTGFKFPRPSHLRPRAAGAAPAAPLLRDMRVIGIGDSLTAGAPNRNYRQWLGLVTNGRLYFPPGSNLGVGGNTMPQMDARIDQALKQMPALALFNGGTNDLSGYSLQQMKDNHHTIVNKLKAINCMVARFTIPKSTAILGSQETQRVAFNDYLKTLTDILLIDLENVFPNPADASMLYDGTHPTAKAAFLMAQAAAAVVMPFIESRSILFADSADATARGNVDAEWDFAGTTGTKTGTNPPTGTVATGWVANNTGAVTGVTIVASKITDTDGRPGQRLVITGTAGLEGVIRLSNSITWSSVSNAYMTGWVKAKVTASDGVSVPVGCKAFYGALGSFADFGSSNPDAQSGSLNHVIDGILRLRPKGVGGAASTGATLEYGVRVLAGNVDIQIDLFASGSTFAELTAYGQPVNITTESAPAITGTGTVGQTLTLGTGTWAGGALSYAYQWRRGGVDIAGATARTYVLQAGDSGASVTCFMTVTNANGSATFLSNAITVA